ncbi:MAG: stage II sporulation protein M [Clostridia bacterium]|nr:stage II sporulation protein M [Clostridia bacterium]
MLSKIGNMLVKHVKNNSSTYFALFLVFITGLSAGAFTVNGLSAMQRDELTHYFQGFLQLFDNQQVDNVELLKLSMMENLKIVAVLWILGVTIIGIPFIYLIIGIRGFITGFASGFLVEALGFKGVLFTLLTLFPKEIIFVPCIIALGVNGINFSLNIIKSRSAKHLFKESLRTSFLAYCFVTLFYSCFILGGIFLEAYITPVVIRIISPIIAN